MTRYDAFIKIIETGSFSKAAQELGYTQSAISQMIHALEEELNTILIVRSRKGISLTPDGKEFLPYINSVYNAHRELLEKKREMEGLQSGTIRIGTFSSVSANWLPGLMQDFKKLYPSVHFELHQGEYTSISNWIKEGSVDFGFVNPLAVHDITTSFLSQDELLAVLPFGHALASQTTVTFQELSKEPFILLAEGDFNDPLYFFRQNHLEPNIQYVVHDDYTIMSMVEKNMGIAILPKLVLTRCHFNVVIKSLRPAVSRTISLGYKNKKVLPVASRYFMDFILHHFEAFSSF